MGQNPLHGDVDEITAGNRFSFGRNWSYFLNIVDDRRIELAENSLQRMLGLESLAGKKFLDAGSGSGLFSLAARRLGATVYSFDYDRLSVKTTKKLKEKYFPGDAQWTIQQGSVLEKNYLADLGKFDIVYSWGVLHHTGEMYRAFDNISSLVSDGGMLYISIYNDQGWISSYWRIVKKLYNKNILLKYFILLIHTPYLFGARWMYRTLSNRKNLERGMSIWYDAVDWLGGYPFEVAKPESVFNFFKSKGFKLNSLKTCGRKHGCNEFVFQLESKLSVKK